MNYEFWVEGYQTTGESSCSAILSVNEADSFDNAMDACNMDFKFKQVQELSEAISDPKNKHLFTKQMAVKLFGHVEIKRE